MPAFSSKFHSVHSMSIILTYGLAYLFSSLFLESESKNCRFLARHSVCANIMFAFSIHVQATGQELKFCAYFVHSRYKYTLCTPLTPRVPLGSRFALGVRKILYVSFPTRNFNFSFCAWRAQCIMFLLVLDTCTRCVQRLLYASSFICKVPSGSLHCAWCAQ